MSTFVNLTLNAIIIHNGSYTFWHFARVVWNFRLSLALTCRSIPLQERSRAVAVVFGGLSFGSVLGYVLTYMVANMFMIFMQQFTYFHAYADACKCWIQTKLFHLCSAVNSGFIGVLFSAIVLLSEIPANHLIFSVLSCK